MNDFKKWSTIKVERFLDMVENGEAELRKGPFYNNNSMYRKANAVFEYTNEEIREIARCAKDIKYFAERYASVMTDDGVQVIKLRDYQENIVAGFAKPENRFNILLASRQVGKTIMSAIYIAHYILFNFDRNVFLIANIQKTSKETMDKVKVILENLPFFLKPGIIKNDVMEMKFDNGCRIVTGATTKRAGISFTIHLLFLDEFAHVADNIQKEFYYNIYPTISSSKISRVIITSTPNGFNLFHDIYTAAEKGENEYTAWRIDWWDVPGRDQQWYKDTVANLGSEEAFNLQYGNSFITADGRLLSPGHIERLQRVQEEDYVLREFEELIDLELDYEKYTGFRPDYDIDRIRDKNNFFLFSIDIAEGGGGSSDYSIINIFEIDTIERNFFREISNPTSFQDFFGLKQIARFRSNELSIEDFSKIAYTLMFDIFYSENVKLVLELNTYGGEFLKTMQTIFPGTNEFDEEIVVKFKHKVDSRVSKMGLKVRADNKPIMAQKFKKYYHVGRFDLTDTLTVEEAVSFGKDKKGRYMGLMGHDDLIMTCINSGEFFTTMDYADFIDEKFELIDDDIRKEINEILDLAESDGDTLNYDIYDIVGGGSYNVKGDMGDIF